jgi:hypothetical protein
LILKFSIRTCSHLICLLSQLKIQQTFQLASNLEESAVKAHLDDRIFKDTTKELPKRKQSKKKNGRET